MRSAINGWADELPRLVAQYALFASRPDVTLDAGPDGTKVVGRVVEARAKLAEGPLAITDGRTFTYLRNAVEKVIETYRACIDAAWSVWVKNSDPKVDDAELAPFEADPEYRLTVSELKLKRGTLRRHEKEPAESETGFQEVERLVAELRTLRDRLPITAPDEVKKFLAATNSRDGAPLDMLTEAVRTWLSGE